jgi:hypothetical protein
MIFKDDVKKHVQNFIRSALYKFPNTADAMLAHPSLEDWYQNLAVELTSLEAASLAEGKPFDPYREIKIWAAAFVEHCLEKSINPYADTIRKTVVD